MSRILRFLRPIDIGRQPHPVSHRDHHAPCDASDALEFGFEIMGQLGTRSGRQGFTNQGQQLGIGREPLVVLMRDLAVVHPDTEFAAPAHFKDGNETGLLLDKRRHTGGARQVVSSLAVTDADAVHACIIGGWLH